MSPQPQVSYAERLGIETAQWQIAANQFAARLRVAIPGIIQTFDATKQTATVQIAIRERVLKTADGLEWEAILPLQDVPVVLPRAGGYTLTMPIIGDEDQPGQGTECLLVFADMCIDAWFASGGVQDQQTVRRHTLSDAFAIIGCWSQPNKLANYNTTAPELRSDDGNTVITLDNTAALVTVKATNIKLDGDVEVTGSLTGDQGANFQQDVIANGTHMHQHKHSGVSVGGGQSGPPVPGTE